MSSSLPQTSSILGRKTSKLAIASMVLGLISPIAAFATSYFHSIYSSTLKSFLSQAAIVVPISFLATIFGITALNRMDKYPSIKGRWMAIVGLAGGGFFVVMYMFILLFVFLLLFYGRIIGLGD